VSELLPLFLKLGGRGVLVVGAGEIASRKVAELLGVGATVTVVAPEIAPSIAEAARRGRLRLRERAFEPGDVDGAWLVVACTGDTEVQRGVAAACDASRIFCVAVDDPSNASGYFGSVLRRPPVIVAMSSSGEAPALTRLMREVFESALPPASWVDAAKALREAWKRDGTPMSARFPALLRALTAESRRDDAPVDDVADDEERRRG
jgi:siroheme synthase-like protein